MSKLLIGALVLLLAGVLIRFFAVADTVTATNDLAALATLNAPAGFIDASDQQGCRGFDSCFRTDGVLAPMTKQNGTTLISEFAITVSHIACQPASAAGTHAGLACTGEGTLAAANRIVRVFFSVISGASINVGHSGPPQSAQGTYATFSTSALRRLPASLTLG